jgi:oligopeptide/dipeptide ABC transporter ATP-binding protein
MTEAGRAGAPPLLEVRDLKKHFPIHSGILRRPSDWLKAVDGVSFQVRRGETLGIVGESGCGKTTLGRVILRLLEPTSGEVLLEGRNISGCSLRRFRPLRRHMQIIFQDPFASLHPRLKAGRIISEPLAIHRLAGRRQRRERARELIEVVGLDSKHLDKYPHEFSGGQQQRIVIARALSLNPALVVCDEPVSSLDVSIQSQILNLLRDLQSRFGLTYLFISHNLAVVRHISDRVGVMYLGQLVELAPVEELYGRPLHPYTQALFSAIPVADPKMRRERILLSGDVPSPVDIPPGCRFAGRCRHRLEICGREEPRLVPRQGSVPQGDAGSHLVRCHLYGELHQ